MTSTTTPVEPLEIPSIRDVRDERHPLSAQGLLTMLAASGCIAAGVVGAMLDTTSRVGPGQVLSGSLVALWGLCAFLVARRRPDEPLASLMTVGAGAGALALLGSVFAGRDLGSSTAFDVAFLARAVGVALMPAVGLHLLLGLPDGALRTRARRVLWGLGDTTAIGIAVYLFSQRPGLPLTAVTVVIVVSALIGAGAFLLRAQAVPLAGRARFQWPAWGVLVAVGISIAVGVLNLLVDWPDPIRAIAVGSTAVIPLSLAFGASKDLNVRIDRLLVHTITLAGLAALVGASYLLIVLGLGRSPTGTERSLLGLSMLAAAVAALLWVPARERLTEFASRRVYGERHAPDEVLRTFGSRLTRALPLDELLLQLAESLKKTMSLDRAEVWTRSATGRLERAVSVPDRGAAQLSLTAEEEPVVARAGVSGPAWARVWLPAVLEGASDPVLRVAPVTNSGELLGLLVARRVDGAPPFEDADDRALTELARQVGLALHNVKLDSALQESLEEVQRQADELRASRARIVEAGDAQRRSIERDLHDGAQQHLVALAVSVRLARQLTEKDPAQATAMLDQIGTDLQDAVQELRNLAHGIYPPLLAERGLPEALSAAASRAALPTSVHAEGVGRYPQQIEAAIYFCCLEALQNAGKHAGEGAEAVITVREDEGALLFDVVDNGAGFDMASGAQRGHGFVNMNDRVGAIGGTVTVQSAPGQGTSISGRIPLSE